MNESQPHPINSVVNGDGVKPKPLGGASHLRQTDAAAALARKYTMEQLGQPPEAPEIGLSGASIPSAVIYKEKVEHRFVIYLKCQGYKVDEISEMVGYTPEHVRTILNQPWARQQQARLMEETDAAKMIPRMLEAAATGAVMTLIDIRDDPKSPAGTRVAAANSLLDRYLGKPAQTIKAEVARAEPTADDEIEQRLAELEAKQKDLIGRPKLREIPTIEVVSDSAA